MAMISTFSINLLVFSGMVVISHVFAISVTVTVSSTSVQGAMASVEASVAHARSVYALAVRGATPVTPSGLAPRARPSLVANTARAQTLTVRAAVFGA